MGDYIRFTTPEGESVIIDLGGMIACWDGKAHGTIVFQLAGVEEPLVVTTELTARQPARRNDGEVVGDPGVVEDSLLVLQADFQEAGCGHGVVAHRIGGPGASERAQDLAHSADSRRTACSRRCSTTSVPGLCRKSRCSCRPSCKSDSQCSD